MLIAAAIFAASVASVVVAIPAAAQQARPAVSAQTGVYGETYSINGRPDRRPPQSLRFYANPSFSWLGVEFGSSFMWSTEDQFTAQTMNRFYLNPRWSWGELHAGDYTPSLSRFTASAVRLRGAGIDLSPGRFRFAVTGGLAQDASDQTAFDAAPRRVMYAGLVGFGDPARSFIELSALRAIDDSSGADTLSVSPQENVVAALAAGLTVGRVRVRTELGASLFSRDIRASELDSTSAPNAAQGVFTPRLSSRLDRAYSVEARLALPAGSVGVQVEEIGPGFTTLGNPYLPNDKQELRLVGSYRLFRGRLAGSGSVGARRDNLTGDKRATTDRRTGSVALTLLTGRWLVSSISVLQNGLTRDPAPLPPGSPDPGLVDSFRVRNVSRSLALVEQASFRAAGVPQTLTLSVSAQLVDDDSPRFGNELDASSTSITADWSATLAERLTLSLRPGFERFTGAGRDESFGSLGVGATRRAPRSRWNAGVFATRTQVQDGAQWRANATAGVRLGERDQLSFNVRHTRLRGVTNPFTESVASMRLTRRW